MGVYTTGEFLELFGGLPERGDRNWVGPDPDELADQIDALSRASVTPAPPESEKEQR